MHPMPDYKHGRQLTAVRVLLIEDDEPFAGLVRANLERVEWGELSIEHAATMRDALARLERGGIDLVITDLNLPDSKDLDTVESLVRVTDRLILVLTGERDERLREAALEAGAYDLMSKDRVDHTELERLVRLAAMHVNSFRTLRDSEERFRALAELAADWYWEQDAELRFVATGSATNAPGGITTAEAYVGKRRWELPGTEILNQTWDEHKAVLAARKPFHDLMLRRLGPSGVAHYISVSGGPIFDQGRFRGYRGVGKDVSARVRMDLRLAIEHSVTRLLGEANSIAEASPRIIRMICETLGWTCGARYESDERSQTMVCAETWGIPSAAVSAFLEVPRGRPMPLTESGLNRRAWTQGRPMWIRDVTQDASFVRAPDAVKAGLHSAFAFPIKVDAQSIGAMEFFSREIHQPDAELLECMTNVGSQIGQFIQRKRAEEEQRRFRAAIDVSADLVLLVDPESVRLVDANETACRTLGYSREELLAMGPHDVYVASREDLAQTYRGLIAGDAGATSAHGWFRRKDGSRFAIELSRRVVPSGKGHVIVVVARDVGERKRSEQLLKLEHTVTRSLAEARTVSEGLKDVIRRVCETLDWECGRYFRVDEQAGLLRFAEGWSVPDEPIERYVAASRSVTHSRGVGLTGHAWQSGAPLWIADVSKDPRTAEKALSAKIGMHAAFVFPLISAAGNTIGVLAFDSRQSREPDTRLLQSISVIGSQIGQFVQRKEAEEVLRESEARFRSLTELSSDWYWEQDEHFRFTGMTDAIRSQAGLDASDRIGKTRWDLPALNMSEADWAAHRAVLEAHRPFHDLELCRATPEGKLVYISISGQPIFDAEGRFKGYRGVGKDVTARKRGEEELRRFRSAIDSSADMVLLVDRATMRYLDVNEAVCRLLGYSREELLKMGPEELLLRPQDLRPVGRKELERAHDELIANPGVHTGMRAIYRCKDGSLLPTELTRTALSSGNADLTVVIARDIRAQIAAEKAIRESEARFRSLTQLSSDMYWEQDEQFRFTSQSGVGSKRVGAEVFPLIGKKRWEQNYVNMTADDWARHRALLEAHLPFRDLELCRLDESRQKVWLSISGEPVFGDDGAFKGYRGVGKDITGRKRAEQLVELEHKVTRSLSEAESASAGLVAAIRAVCETEGWECGRYFHPDEKAGVLCLGASWGVPIPEIERFIEASRDLVYAPGVGLLGRVWQSGEPMWVPDVHVDERVSQAALARNWGIHGAFVFPVMSEGKTIGVLAFNSREARQQEERLLQAMGVIGSQIGQFVRRQQAERVRRESEEKFRALTELSSDMYWTQDTEYRFTSFSGNSRALAIRLLGKCRWDEESFNMTPADWAAHKALLDARQPFRDVELGRTGETGETWWVSISGAPVFDDAGNFIGYRGISKNITARKRAEHLRALEHAVSRSLTEVESASEGLKAAIRAVCESEHWECGRYFQVDEKAGLLRFADAWAIPDPDVERFIEGSRHRTYSPGVGLSGLVWQSGQTVWCADITKDPRASSASAGTKAPRELGAHGTFVFPVFSDGKTIGVLSFASRKFHEPEERLLEAVHVIGGQIGQFVQRKQAEEVRRESEERFRSLTGLSSDWYWEQDTDYRFTLISSAVKDGAGAGPKLNLGKARWDQPALNMTEADWAAHRALLDARKPFYNLELQRRTEEGLPRYISISGEPMFDAAGAFKGYRGIGKDITERKRAEQLVMLEHTVARSLAAADDIPQLLKAAIRAVCETEGWECGRYFRVDENAGLLRFAEAWSVSGELMDRFIEKSRGLSYKPGVGLMGQVWQSGEPIWSADIAKDPRIHAGIAREIGMHGSFVFPVRSEGKTIGVLIFHSREIRQAEPRLLSSISVIGSQIGQFMQRKQAEERQARHTRYQEKIARFGASALAKREAVELVEDALQTVIEALPTTVVAYVEPGAEAREVVMRGLTGLASGEGAAVAVYDSDEHLARPLERGELAIVDRPASGPGLLPFYWAGAFSGAALVPVHGDNRVQGALCVLSETPGVFGAEESKFLVTAASVLSAGLRRIHSEGRLAFLAQFDALTGLPNRALLADRFSQMIVQARRHAKPLGVLFIDLDDFKLVNDSLGHAGGDELLKETARRLQSSVRAGDTVARISGDEFAVILGDLARPDDAAIVAQKIIDCLATPVKVRGHEVFVTASIGIAAFPADGGDAEALLGAADAAMYRAKQSGRNAYQFFTADINQRTRARAQLGSELRRALERGEFALAYQPKFDLRSGRPCAAEALLRWRHPERGLVPPVEFIPVLEETGLIVQVGEWVLRRACEDLKAWRAAGLLPMQVAVNLSARQFRQQDLHVRIRDLVSAAGVAPEMIELEITESQLMQDPDHARRVIQALSEGGIGVAIDDFGTGYSSLSYLTRFPVSALKIDRSFVADVLSDRAAAAIVRTIIDMAHTLGFIVIAEGVETEAQAVLLRGLGCEQAQGYFFAKPQPEAEFRKLIASYSKDSAIDSAAGSAGHKVRRKR